MKASYGPWATTIHVGASPQLSIFWKRRLKMLANIKSIRPLNRSLWCIVTVGVLACAIPTIRQAPAEGPSDPPPRTDKVSPQGRNVSSPDSQHRQEEPPLRAEAEETQADAKTSKFVHPRLIKKYAGAKTLGEAVQVLHGELKARDEAVYTPLLTAERVKAAIATAIESRERYREADIESAKNAADAERERKSLEYFQRAIKPVLIEIRDKEVWPKNCYFKFSEALQDVHGVTHEGLLLRLTVETPGESFPAHALAIFDALYGRAR